jgi:thymidylate kinase
MGTVVLFDGSDKVGKTEMARELSKRLNIPYFKNESEWNAFSNDPSYFKNALRYGDPYFYNFLKKTGTSVILDRSYPSEWVYSNVYNRSTDVEALNHVDSLAASMGVKIIIPYRTSYEGLHDDMHDIDAKQMQKISDTYADFIKWTRCDTLHMCIDAEDIDWEMKTILEFIEKN